jgi:hypothetical protein
MKIVWLVFEYDRKKLSDVGRGQDMYHDNIEVFKYTTASIKTFLAHNNNLKDSINIFTDNKFLMVDLLKQYDVFYEGLNVYDIKDKIEDWKLHSYPWNPKAAFLKYISEFNDDIFFIDNDCICKNNVDVLIESIKSEDKIYFWEKERKISESREYWGWKAAAKNTGNPEEYYVYNDGIIVLGKRFIEQGYFDNSYNMMETIWKLEVFTATQLATCFVAQQLGLEIGETKDYFDHHYGDKSKCLEFI